MKYLINISPVTRNQSTVVKYLTNMLGPEQKNKAEKLVLNGGTVAQNLFKAAADNYVDQLRELGVEVELLSMEEVEPGEQFLVRLLDAGDHKLKVIKVVRNITKFGLKDAKNIADEHGIVAENLNRKEAGNIKTILEKAGARVRIEEMQSPEPKPEPDPEDPKEPEQPESQDQLAAANVYELSDTVSIKQAVAKALVDSNIRLETLDETHLSSLVKDGTIQETDAQQIADATSLYRVLDHHIDLVKAVKKQNKDIQQPVDLVGFDQNNWKKLIKKQNITPPVGMSEEAYAQGLERKFANLYPTVALGQMLHQFDVSSSLKGASKLEPLQKLNPGRSVFEARDFNALETGDLSKKRVKTLRSHFQQLNTMMNRYPGQDLSAVLANKDLSWKGKEQTIQQRTQLVDTFFQQNKKKNLFSLDLSYGSDEIDSLDFGDASEEQRPMILSTAKAYQRSLSLAGDFTDAQKLVTAGYSSSMAIASKSRRAFLHHVNLDDKKLREIYQGAQERAASISAKAGIAIENYRDLFPGLNVSNQSQEIDTYLAEIPGYEDFFGNQNYCNCKHCRSILSPAAYFADLMGFVDDHVTNTYFGDSPDDHPLSLKSRRPDLWKLELTCENTNGVVPYLDVINTVLENAIAREKGSINMEDRTEVHKAVYEEVLPATGGNQIDSFRQPQLLAFEQFKIYLEHYDRTLGDIADVFRSSDQTKARADLELSDLEAVLVEHPYTSLSFLKSVYGIDDLEKSNGEIVISSNGSDTEAPDVQDFLSTTYLSRNEFGRIIKTRYVQGDESINIKGEKRTEESVQNDIERIYGLSPAALDRIHRFTRLWRAVPWTIGELDLVLEHLASAELSNGIEVGQTLQKVARLRKLQQRLDQGPEELIALWDKLPDRPVGEGLRSFFDQVYNLESFLEMGQTKLPVDNSFLHPAFQKISDEESSDKDSEPMLRRLLAATELGAEAFLNLIRGLAGRQALDFNPQAESESDRKFALNRKNLSLIYRHARLSKLLEVPTATLFRLLKIDPNVSGGVISTSDENVLDKLEAAVGTITWWSQTGWTIDELEYILGGDRPNSTPKPPKVAQNIVDEVAEKESLVFAETFFSVSNGLTEKQSRAIIHENKRRFEKVPDDTDEKGEAGVQMYRLAADFDFSNSLTIPSALDIDANTNIEPDLREALRSYHSSKLLRNLLTTPLGIGEDKLTTFVEMIGEDLGDIYYMKVLQGKNNNGKPLENLIKQLLPLTVLFNDEKNFTGSEVKFVANNLNIFGISAIGQLNFKAIQSLEAYRRLRQNLKNYDAQEMHNLLRSFQQDGFNSDDVEALANILSIEGALVSSLLGRLNLGDRAVEALHQLRRSAELAEHIGLGGEAMHKALSNKYSELSDAASALVAAFRAKYDDEDEYREKVRPFEDRVRTRKRDGLVEFMLHSTRPHFDEPSDLYAYYLLDVELEGCARTSPIVAANSSLQLYVQRVLMNLEQSSSESGQQVHVKPSAIPKDQWKWRKHYRLWEANRKVFLHPENYLEPGLRDNKTPLFEQLEDDLLSQEINEDSVRKAYAKYLRGFEEVANLTITGSHYERRWAKDALDYVSNGLSGDVLHLFGATSDDPPQYYYRRVENAKTGVTEDEKATGWTPWEKIDVKIPVKKVSPILFQNRLYIFWVTYVTKPDQKFEDGNSEFKGYHHTMSVFYTKRRLDGTWVEPQKIKLDNKPFKPDNPGVIQDKLVEKSLRFLTGNLQADPRYKLLAPKFSSYEHKEPKEGYKLDGFRWDRVYPEVDLSGEHIRLRGRDFKMWSELDLYNNKIGKRLDEIHTPYSSIDTLTGIPLERTVSGNTGRVLVQNSSKGQLQSYKHTNPFVYRFSDYNQRLIEFRPENVTAYEDPLEESTSEQWSSEITDPTMKFIAYYGKDLITFKEDPNILLVHGSADDAIIDTNKGSFYLQEGVTDDDQYVLRRLNTGIVKDIGRDLFSEGIDEMLSTQNQMQYGEPDLPFESISNIKNDTDTGDLNFTGPMGAYFREIFFHIPFLIANHLNSRQKYEEAREWYHKIFNPTAAETNSDDSNAGDGTIDRAWRYREFRGQDMESLRDMLTSAEETEQYRKDPFNPYAIARIRLSAFQKAIVMKYIDNLLDWGDDLFARDTRESVREASLLYTMASDILGDRPAEIGDCGEGEGEEERSYDELKQELENGSAFLQEIESIVVNGHHAKARIADRRKNTKYNIISNELVTRALANSYDPDIHINLSQLKGITDDSNLKDSVKKGDAKKAKPIMANRSHVDRKMRLKIAQKNQRANVSMSNPMVVQPFPAGVSSSMGMSLSWQISPVFCIPNNEELLGYWDRVEDRLYKIRHCMNIEGEKRRLSLFAPPISPDMLVQARASGLSLQEVMNAVSGNLPPYRFRYLIQKAKQYVGTLQNFGTSLMAAIEKRDAEELAQMRNTHQKNLLNLTESIKEQDIKAAKKELERLKQRKELVKYRKKHYANLIDKNLIAGEQTQAALRFTAIGFKKASSNLTLAASVAHLVPEVGSPFSMKFGGKQLGDSLQSTAGQMRDLTNILEKNASLAGMFANFNRRKQRWKHQKELATKQLKALEKQISSAEIRRDIAKATLERHKQKQDQLDEIIEFYGDKFSNLGFYTWLSDELQSLYRDAYNIAYGFVQLTARAYEFERSEYPNLNMSPWDASHSGLLAGKRLMLDLEQMEKQFIETNYRSMEVSQRFSISQINPGALIQLKKTGNCTFRIPEFYFDLFYPGQYRRRIKAVRLSIPCVTGPYTNVSAKLTLRNSRIRDNVPKEGELDSNPQKGLRPIPPTRSTSVATSTAQGDAGVFNLNFEGQRYMPFEGAGAVSEWMLELPDPDAFPPFNYDSINDVILNISYTAEDDGQLRNTVNGKLKTLFQEMKDTTPTRIISLRDEVSDAYHKLLNSPPGTDVEVDISEKHFQMFLQGHDLEVTSAKFLLDTEENDVGSFELSVNGTTINAFSPGNYGDLPYKDLGSAISGDPRTNHTITINNSGELGSEAEDPSALDKKKIDDMMLVLEYEITQ